MYYSLGISFIIARTEIPLKLLLSNEKKDREVGTRMLKGSVDLLWGSTKFYRVCLEQSKTYNQLITYVNYGTSTGKLRGKYRITLIWFFLK
jgi:hypothetical protein